MKIYFVGRITKGDWRYSFMKPEHLTITETYVKSLDDRPGPYQWPVMRRAIFNAVDYVGPFIEEWTDNVRGFFSGLAAEETSNAFLQGIDEADAVFCWISRESVSESFHLDLGYAIGKNKPIYVALGEGGLEACPFVTWLFGIFATDFTHDVQDPAAALRTMLLKSGALFASPLERLFWQEASPLIPSLTPQHPVAKYYADFAIPEKQIAIEIDGHDFHKTKEHRTRDAQRDRTFTEQGWTVLRFTGTEIFKNVQRCVRQVLSIVESVHR